MTTTQGSELHHPTCCADVVAIFKKRKARARGGAVDNRNQIIVIQAFGPVTDDLGIVEDSRVAAGLFLMDRLRIGVYGGLFIRNCLLVRGRAVGQIYARTCR